jgi:hypothetical protein
MERANTGQRFEAANWEGDEVEFGGLSRSLICRDCSWMRGAVYVM